MQHTTLTLASLLAVSGFAAAQGTDDFENGNPNDWRFDGVAPVIDATGGNPDGNLFEDDVCGNCVGPNATFLPEAPNHPYQGDLRATGVEMISMDMLQVAGASPFGATICVVIGQEGGQPGIIDDCIVWASTGVTLGFGFPSNTWTDVSVGIDTASMTLPMDWRTDTFIPNSCNQTMSPDDIWNSVITNADYIGFHFGFPSTSNSFYNGQLRIDNISVDSGGIGMPYCQSLMNSTGAASTISADGSPSIAANLLTLTADNLPGQPGIFIAGPTQAQLPFFNGFLCIDPSGLQRFSNVASPVGGVISEAVDLASSAPGGLNVVAGSSYNYQRWNRDPAAGGGNANFSNGIAIQYVP